MASLLGYAPKPPHQAALQAATCFSLLTLGAHLHLKCADRAQLRLWYFGALTLCDSVAPCYHMSPGALLWRVARLRYAESIGAGQPVSWMEL